MSYEPLQLGQPGHPACPDKYTEASTRITPGAKRIHIQTSVQMVYLQFGLMPQGRGTGSGSVVWQDEEPYLPTQGLVVRTFDAVRARNYTKGLAAQVMLSFP